MKLLVVSISFLSGTLFASGNAVGAPLGALALFGLAAVLCALLLASRRRSAWVGLIALAFMLGIARVEMSADAPLPSYSSPRLQQVEGVVMGDAEALGNFARFRLKPERIKPGGEWMPAEGTLLVSARADSEIAERRAAPYFRYGDRLLIEGHVSEPPQLEEFDYAAYLARQGISEVLEARSVTLVGENEGSAFYHTLYDFRRRLAASIAVVVPEPQAALGQAALLGLRRGIPTELTEAFRRTGTAHLLAISGLHVGILLSISLAVSATLLGRKHHLHLIAPLLVIWLYGLLAGMSPSATRACIMGSVYLASQAFGRQRGALAPIGCAAALMVAVSPSVLYSISFQLSFAAIGGIAALSDMFGSALRLPAERRLGWQSALRKPLNAVSDMLAVSLAATIATLPLIAFHFERVSTLGIPASALTLPALPFLIMGSAAAALVGLASTTLALPLGWLAWAAGAYLSGVVGLMAELPGASIDIGGLPAWGVLAYYGLLLLVYGARTMFPSAARDLTSMDRLGKMVGLRDSTGSQPTNSRPYPNLSPPRRKEPNLRDSKGTQRTGMSSRLGRIAIWLLVPAAFAASLAWSQSLTGDGRLHVTFFDVGQGDAIFIETPRGRQMVIDGGASPLLMTRLLGERMRFYDRRIDIVVATHPHDDHIGGLAQVLERYDADMVLERRIEYESATYEAWARAVREEEAQGARVLEARAGQVIALDEDVSLEVLGPPITLPSGTESDADNASLVLRLVYGKVSVLLTGDIFAAAERALLEGGAALESDVLKVPHHGSASSSTAEFLSAVSPAAAVILVGADNRFGHPDDDVLRRLEGFVGAAGLYMTSERGTVDFSTDGETLWVRTER